MEVDNGDENQATEENIQGEDVHPGVDEESSEGCTKLELNEPSKKASDRRAVFKKDAMESYIYETGERCNINLFVTSPFGCVIFFTPPQSILIGLH